MKPYQKIIPWLTGGFFIVFLTLILGEGFLRVVWTNPYQGSLDRYVYLREPKPYTRMIYKWPWGRVRYYVDAHGFIFPSMVHEKADYTIAFLGGSTTECLAVPEEKRFPYLVGKYLSEKLNKRINSLNCGISGSNSQHSITVLVNKIRFYSPDMCVLMHATNDLGVLMRHGNYGTFEVIGSHINFVSTLNYLSSKLSLFGLMRQLYMNYQQSKRNDLVNAWLSKKGIQRLAATDPSQTRSPRQSIIEQTSGTNGRSSKAQCLNLAKQFRQNLKMFVHISRDMGITPVLMTQAMNQAERDTNTHKDDRNFLQTALMGKSFCFPAMNQTIRSVAEGMDVLLIDLDAAFSNQSDLFYDGLHYSSAGSEHVAKLIADSLANSGFIPGSSHSLPVTPQSD